MLALTKIERSMSYTLGEAYEQITVFLCLARARVSRVIGDCTAIG